MLGFPCNQFGGQEPGSNAEVKAFATAKGLKKVLFSKIDVNGPKAHPLYVKLKKEAGNKTLMSMLGEPKVLLLRLPGRACAELGPVYASEPETPACAWQSILAQAMTSSGTLESS